MNRTIVFTADLLTPNGGDTDCYGEPCEIGYGYSVESGWWAPKFARFQVSDDREYADTFTLTEEDDECPVEWAVSILREYIGIPDMGSGSDAYVAADARERWEDGSSIRPTAHLSNFLPSELDAIAERMGA